MCGDRARDLKCALVSNAWLLFAPRMMRTAVSDSIPAFEAPWIRLDWIALAVCASVAMLLAILPHLAALVRYRTWEHISDGDEAFYLAITRIPYQGESALRDPAAGKWRRRPGPVCWV